MRRSKKLRRTAYHEAAHAVVLYRAAGHVGGHVTIIRKPIEGGWALGAAFDGYSDSCNPEHVEATLLSLYAGGHAQRELEPSCGEEGCGGDRSRSSCSRHSQSCDHSSLSACSSSPLTLTRQHFTEIVAVANELLRTKLLDDVEVELICDELAGDPDAIDGLARYRERAGEELRAWREEALARTCA